MGSLRNSLLCFGVADAARATSGLPKGQITIAPRKPLGQIRMVPPVSGMTTGRAARPLAGDAVTVGADVSVSLPMPREINAAESSRGKVARARCAACQKTLPLAHP